MHYMRGLRLLVAGAISSLIVLGLTSTSASSANISHAYKSLSTISDGSLVSLNPEHSNYVELANTNNGSLLLGIAVANNDSLIAVDPTNDSTQVATSGIATTLVSTLDGNINVGDQVAVSPFGGIGMKAEPGLYVIGLAQTALNAHSPDTISRSVTNKNGKTTKITIGYVRVNIAIGTDTAGSGLNGIQKFVKSLTGSDVSTARMIISIIVAVVALLALAVLIYASIYGSIISIGRNPLAKPSVFHTLRSVLAMALLTAGTASFIIFLLLR